MLSELNEIRTTRFHAIGSAIQRNVGVILDLWETRARHEQPSAHRHHHADLVDHLPGFLAELGRTLDKVDEAALVGQYQLARIHGDQRWEHGWSIAEVVRDYQILRVVLVAFLEQEMRRPMDGSEVMALGLAIDDAILLSVTSFLCCVSEKQSAATIDESVSTSDAKTPAPDLMAIFGVLGHELRNSLSPLANSLHILRIAGDDSGMVEKTRRLMDRQVKVMARLVDDLMDLPRVARGKVSLLNERLDFKTLISECVEDRQSAFLESNIQVRLNLPVHPIWTTGDSTRLRQVIGNLLSNAVKFTDAGGRVTLTLEALPESGVAEFSIADEGIGIDPSLLPVVFESFHQADRSVERSRGGLGLGLALVKGLIELHGGRVSAHSDGLGRGSTFTVQLPVYDRMQTEGPPAVLPSTSVSACRRVLVIDDHLDLAESTRMILELSGHTVYLAHSGPDGLAVARALLPEVIVCDIGLPGMSGYDVCQALQDEPSLSRALKIALSGHGSASHRERALAAGFDAFILKPFDPTQIAQLIAESESARDK